MKRPPTMLARRSAPAERTARPVQHHVLVGAREEAVHRLVHRRRQGRGEADRAARQHGHGHGDEGGAGADASRIGRHRDAGPGPVDDAHGRAEADRQVVGEPRQIGSETAGDEEVVAVFHVRDVAQADLAERAPGEEPVHRGDALAPRPEEGQGAGRRTVGRRARRLRERPVGALEGAAERGAFLRAAPCAARSRGGCPAAPAAAARLASGRG